MLGSSRRGDRATSSWSSRSSAVLRAIVVPHDPRGPRFADAQPETFPFHLRNSPGAWRVRGASPLHINVRSPGAPPSSGGPSDRALRACASPSPTAQARASGRPSAVRTRFFVNRPLTTILVTKPDESRLSRRIVGGSCLLVRIGIEREIAENDVVERFVGRRVLSKDRLAIIRLCVPESRRRS